jgi:2-polyprenyl-3-methyl-5-hydroxy-6-metoxy-1,4-benzoquinol methylase
MPKSGEIEYIKNIAREYGDHAVRHAVDKPFSDPHCPGYLAEMGAILALLPSAPARLLDLGCGTGWTSIFFARCGYQVTGADIAPEMIRLATEKRDCEGLSNVEFLTADFEELNGRETYDAVVFYDALHHAVDEVAALRCAYRALKPGGMCITSEPGLNHRHSPLALEAVRKYQVTEKSMPPVKIVKLAKQIGFRDFQVYPHAFRVQRAVYGKPHRAGQPGLRSGATIRRVLRLAAGLTLGPFRMLYSSARLAAWTQFACWADGITVLVK